MSVNLVEGVESREIVPTLNEESIYLDFDDVRCSIIYDKNKYEIIGQNTPRMVILKFKQIRGKK